MDATAQNIWELQGGCDSIIIDGLIVDITDPRGSSRCASVQQRAVQHPDVAPHIIDSRITGDDLSWENVAIPRCPPG